MAMKSEKIRKLVTMAMLAALSIVLVYVVHFPIFPAAPFLEYDPADIPILIGTFAYGPVAGIILTVVVSVIQGMTVSASSGFMGIAMHIFATSILVLVFVVLGGIGNIRGSVIAATVLTILPELLRAFRELHPEIKMDVLVRGDELPAALASGEIQLALVDEARAQGFDFLPLADTPLVAVVPPDFPWEGETIPLERLLREPFFSNPDQYIEPFLPPDTPRLEVTASDDGSILSMVAGGLGVSVLSSFSLVGYEGQVRVLQLEKPIALRLGAAVKSVNTIGTSARMFLTFLREYYGKDDTQ